MKMIKDFRNKIAAHTTYSDPKSWDNLSQELHSLLTLISCSHTGSINTFRLGALQIIAGNTEAPLKPTISISGTHPLLVEHFKKWVMMFETVLHAVRPQLPKTINNIDYEI